MTMRLIECVPNFSEGVNADVIRSIANEIHTVEGVKLLNVDPGKGANRTVMTFAGKPGQVVEAAFSAIKKAAELIDMTTHKGEHPRIGATDVCPLIPIANISMEETVQYARRLAQRVGDELGIPVYLYEHAQPDKTRHNLSVIRTGQYEGFFEKIKLPGWRPDFGPDVFHAKHGATVIGARDFLIAYNVNLNTTSAAEASAIAADVRETGRKIIENGNPVIIPGRLKSVKAMGWYIKEYGFAQVSMNLTNINTTPLHRAFEEVRAGAAKRGTEVTGSELVGLIPLKAMLDAGRYFLQKHGQSIDVGEQELIQTAANELGLSQLSPFTPHERIIEYVLNK
jgi:glutamate formiminotransferase / formiminotetrahydrofolate cyclodeaminase